MRLVKEARLQGWRILEAMHYNDSFDFQISAAFWIYDEEREAWRLYMVTSQVGAVGALPLYGELQKILAVLRQADAENTVPPDKDAFYVNEDESLMLDDILLVGPRNAVAEMMRRRHASVPFDRSVVRHVSLTSAEPYVYKI